MNDEQFSFKKVLQKKLRAILFKEPYFTQFLKDKSNCIKSEDITWSESEKPFYTRYLNIKSTSAKSDVSKRQIETVREVQSHKLVNFVRDCYLNENKLYTDMQIYADEQLFNVHRLIIACFIPIVFYRLSKCERNNETRKIKLTGISASAFQVILDYIYIGQMKPSQENFFNVLETSFKLLMHEFAEIWIEMYEECLGTTTERLLFRYRISKKFQWKDYSEKIAKILALDLQHLLLIESFITLQFEELLEIVKQDEIGVESEIVVFIAVMKWLNNEWPKRQRHATALMAQVRFSCMNEDELFACLNPPILKEVIETPEIKNAIADALNFIVHTKTNKNSATETIDATKRRHFRTISTQKLKLWTSSD